MTIPLSCAMLRTALLASIVALGVGLSGPAVAGPLNPPASAITSTGKPLAEVEPRTAINAANTPGDNDGTPSVFKITQPGSYYLTAPITSAVSAGKNGIEVVVVGEGAVTIDLCGFEIVGGAGSGNGILATANAPRGLTVRNGVVRGWAIGAETSADAARLENVTALFNSANGLRVAQDCVVVGCTAVGNGGTGIVCGFGTTVTGCSSSSNSGDGFDIGGGSAVIACSARFNSGNGFDISTGCALTGCAAQANTLDGIQLGTGCTASGCTGYGSGAAGISTGSGCTIDGCTARNNNQDGVRINGDCVVRGCTASGNGAGVSDAAGIHALGSRNRIEGNLSNGNDRGFDVDGEGNILVRNTASNNTNNWALAANNFFGTIVDRTLTGSAAVSSNAAAGTLGTTDGNANFTH